jgi:hypothetical protein
MRLFIQIIDRYAHTHTHTRITGRCRVKTPDKKKERKKCRVQLRRERRRPRGTMQTLTYNLYGPRGGDLCDQMVFARNGSFSPQ